MFYIQYLDCPANKTTFRQVLTTGFCYLYENDIMPYTNGEGLGHFLWLFRGVWSELALLNQVCLSERLG